MTQADSFEVLYGLGLSGSPAFMILQAPGTSGSQSIDSGGASGSGQDSRQVDDGAQCRLRGSQHHSGSGCGSGGDGRKPNQGWPGNRQFFLLYEAKELELLMELLEMLAAAGVPLRVIKDGNACSLLHLASRDGHLSIVQFLIQHIPVNDRDNRGYTPLHYASQGNHFAIAITLIHAQADVNACPEGTINTPAAVAKTQDMLDFIRCFGGEGPNHPGDNWHPGPHF